jgi:hypothetical protein
VRIDKAVLLLLLWPAVALYAEDSLDGCLAVQAQLPPTDPPDEATLTLTNNCGKDITAYLLEFRDSSGRLASGFSEDIPVRLAHPAPRRAQDDILVSGKSAAVKVAVANSTSATTVKVAAILFADRSAFGAQEDVDRLIRFRRGTLTRLQAEYEALKEVGDYAEAKATLQLKAEAAKASNAPDAGFLRNLQQQLDRSDANSWATAMAHYRQWYVRAIALYQDHLQQNQAR